MRQCACVRAHDTERQRERHTQRVCVRACDRERQKASHTAHVRVCVCDRERQTERERDTSRLVTVQDTVGAGAGCSGSVGAQRTTATGDSTFCGEGVAPGHSCVCVREREMERES